MGYLLFIISPVALEVSIKDLQIFPQLCFSFLRLLSAELLFDGLLEHSIMICC